MGERRKAFRNKANKDRGKKSIARQGQTQKMHDRENEMRAGERKLKTVQFIWTGLCSSVHVSSP